MSSSMTGSSKFQIHSNQPGAGAQNHRYTPTNEGQTKILRQKYVQNEHPLSYSVTGVPKAYNGIQEESHALQSPIQEFANYRLNGQQKGTLPGRKGHQVMQSQGFNKAKSSSVNKSFDTDKIYQSYLNVQTPLGQAQNNSRQMNQQLLNFQTTGVTTTAAHGSNPQGKRRNNSYGVGNAVSALSKPVQSNERKSKPVSRGGPRLVEAPNTRNSRLGPVGSTHKRNFTILDASTTNALAFTTAQPTPATITHQRQSSENGKQTIGGRPKTSTGHYGAAIDRYNTISNQGNIVNSQDLREELEQIMQQNIQLNSQQKEFILKKGGATGERNEGLRSYLRKSLDQVQTASSVVEKTQTSVSKIKRKRDYSKVVGNSGSSGQQFLTLQQNQPVAHQIQPGHTVFSPLKSGKGVKKNLYQDNYASMKQDQTILDVEQTLKDQYNTIQNDENKQKLVKNIRDKAHFRSLTSHKISRPGQPTGAGEAEDVNATIIQEEIKSAKSRQQTAQSMERPKSSQKRNAGGDANLRASITQEVTTAQMREAQQTNNNRKVDNCVTKFAFATKTGYSPSNPLKINQDSFLAMPHLGEYRRTHFFSVCDGHGVFGKEVSDFVKTILGQRVEVEIKSIFDKAKQSQRVVDSNEVKDALAVSFAGVTNSLAHESGIDLYFSGSTCVSILIVGNKVFCANVGDSRAVLARDCDGVLCGYPLNRDHKANEPDEEERILRNGGRVDAYRDQMGRPMGPMRVWQMHQNIPGLAMSRSFGDGAAAEVGVISDPEILEMNLTEDDRFIILASDGVWEFLSNDEVVNIVRPHYLNNSAEKAAEAVIRESLKKWKQEENVVDDITCIIIFLSIS